MNYAQAGEGHRQVAPVLDGQSWCCHAATEVLSPGRGRGGAMSRISGMTHSTINLELNDIRAGRRASAERMCKSPAGRRRDVEPDVSISKGLKALPELSTRGVSI